VYDSKVLSVAEIARAVGFSRSRAYELLSD
jgi:predicted DNA-binding transcriptional regulator AlpA